ncbi:MAG: cation:proton antiporter [Caulobacterales bacterium]|nr:cation:proton antiporter [Caulobacterales bacterium]
MRRGRARRVSGTSATARCNHPIVLEAAADPGDSSAIEEGLPLSPFELATIFLTAVAAGAWVNARTARLPHGVAMLLVGLAGALAILALRALRPELGARLQAMVAGANFAQTVLGYLLGFLLFAGAMQVDLAELRKRRLAVWSLATLGVAASTGVVGVGLWLAARALGLDLPLTWALVFGALISPTDPIAVLATVKGGALSKRLQVILQGEALFNDGVGIVVFTALLALAGGAAPSPLEALGQVVVQAAGGLALGVGAGWIVVRAMRSVDDFVAEVALSVALAMAVYAGAQALHLSGAIAAVGAGLLVGEGCRSGGSMSATTEVYLRSFWTLVDELLNALLFLLMGLQLVFVSLRAGALGLCAAAIVLVLGARFAVVLPWGAWLRLRHEERGASLILAWGGLHGALSLALALSLPESPQRPLILAATYAVAAFSVAVQGLTFEPLTRRVRGPA